MSSQIHLIYQKLYFFFGPQHWWPADTPFEVMIGAILTQNTSWSNVEKAIRNLKDKKLLTPTKVYKLSPQKLGALIKPTGYYNIKARRIKNFLRFFSTSYQASIKRISLAGVQELRRQLLCVNGIGPETADSMLLYALSKPVFVVDAYTKRILHRHGLIKEDWGYDQVQALFVKCLKPRARLFNEYHALLVRLGKEFCLKKKPKCALCPLQPLLRRQ
jgi:endonuclease-3 related protein